MVVELFSPVKNKQVVADSWEKHPFRDDQLGSQVYVTPIKDVRNLNLVFPCGDYIQDYKSAVSTACH